MGSFCAEAGRALSWPASSDPTPRLEREGWQGDAVIWEYLFFSQSFQVVRAIVVRWVLSSEAESFELLVLETSSVNSVSFFGAQNAENGLYGEHFWPSPWRSCHESEHSFNLTSQVVFRHPMDRLVSAYRMIFQNWWVLKLLHFSSACLTRRGRFPGLCWY